MHNIPGQFLKRLFIFAIAACFVFTAAAPASYAGTSKYVGSKHIKKKHKVSKRGRGRAVPQVDRYAHIVIDAQSGFVLSEKNPDKRLYPASLTKMMTLYLTFEAIEKGQLTKYKRVPVSSNAQYQPPSKLGLEAGYSIRVEDGILALVTRSANDAAVVLGDAVGGSESRFARMMTEKARTLGMRNTHFVNASGLHDPEQYSTARDMAILAQALMRDYPRYYRYFSTPSFTYAGVTSLNHNKLMATYPGMDGMKTGYVYASGYNLAASAVQDSKRLIGVVFGGRTASARNEAMRDLLDAGFLRMKDNRVASLIQQRLDTARGTLPRKKPGQKQNINSGQPVQLAQATNRMAPVTARTQTTKEAPAFSPMGLTEEEGDTQAPELQPAAAAAPVEFKPRPMNTSTLSAPPPARKPVEQPVQQPPQQPVPQQLASATTGGTWAVQIGAFANQNAGMTALRTAHGKLPQKITRSGKYVISPLQTNRGTIYRARLSGLDQAQAASACQVLQGSCLVMAVP